MIPNQLPGRRCLALLASVALASTQVQAQSAPVDAATLAKYDVNKNGRLDPDEVTAQSADLAKAGEAVLMNPFQVSTEKDTGYIAANSLAGGRADTPLKLTPASISVMTKEFMEDFNITDMRAAAGWTLNMEAPTNQNEGPFGGNNFQMNFRATGGGANYPSRNYSLFYFTADSYNSERFEFARGPNALLFGDAGIGGMASQMTKQARFNDRRVTTSLQGDSYGGWRATADASYGLDRFAVRVNLLGQDKKSFQDGTFDRTDAIHVAASFKVSADTQVRAEVERHHENALQWRRTYAENASIWDRQTFADDITTTIPAATQTAAGIQQVSANADYNLFNFGAPSAGWQNYRGNQYRTIGLGYQIPWGGRPDLATNFKKGVGKDYNLGPGDSTMDRTLGYKAIYLDHRFTPNAFAQIAYIRHDYGPETEVTESLANDYRIDINRLLPNGQPNPMVGKAFADITQSSQYQSNAVEEVRLLGTYRFEKQNWFDWKQRFSFIGGWREDRFEMWQRRWVWANNPAQSNLTNAANQLRYRIYWDQPMTKVGSQVPPVVAGREFRFVDTGFSADNERDLTFGQIVSQSTFWEDRISLILGFRRDKVAEDLQNSNGNDANGRPIFGFINPATRAFEVGFHGSNPTTVDSKNAGAVIFPIKRISWLGLTYNYSENFSIPPTGNPLITGVNPAPPRGKTKEYGVIIDLGSKVYATMKRYDSEQIGSIVNGGNTADFNTIWTQLGYTDQAHTIAYRDLQSISAKGYEFEITANPTRNLRLTFNHSRPDRTTIEDSPGRIAYVAANRAEWVAGSQLATGTIVNGRTIGDPLAITTAIQNIDNSLNGLTNGTTANGTMKNSTNLAATYSFNQGMLKGLDVGVGAQLRGNRKIGSRDAQIKFNTTTPTVAQTAAAAYDYIYGPKTQVYTAFLSYKYRFGQKIRAKFQLNVENLLNNDDPAWTSYNVINEGQLTPAIASGSPGRNPRMQVVNGFTQFDPRRFVLSSTFAF